MSDYSELKRLASLAKNWSGEIGEDDWYTACCFDKPKFSVLDAEFIAKCEPGSVLSLIAEVEGLRKLPTAWSEVYEQSDELDALRDEKLAWLNARDQLKAEVEKLRKDAERLDWLCGQSRPVVEGQTMSNPEGELAGYDWGVFGACGTVREAIDYAMSKGDQP